MKKIICIFVAFILVCSCMVSNGFAIDEPVNEPTVVENNTTEPTDSSIEDPQKPSQDDESHQENASQDANQLEPSQDDTSTDVTDVNDEDGEEENTEEAIPELTYQANIQTSGWQSVVKGGQTAGTIGEYKRMEAYKVNIDTKGIEGSIEYRSYVEGSGWETSWKTNGTVSGTVGKSLRIEAFQMKLTGEIANQYDLYYRAHMQHYGWLGWAKNGEKAGTSGMDYRVEGMEVILVRKGESAPESTKEPFKQSLVNYQAHTQTYGWQKGTYFDGAIAGTVGQSKRMEAVRIKLNDQLYSGNIEYRTHVQKTGWEKTWKSNGAISGTTGKYLRIEAIQIRLTGEMAKHYDVYYRVHSQHFGWLGWTKNGEMAGTTSFGYRMEAIQIQLVEKGTVISGGKWSAYIKPGEINYSVYAPSKWSSTVKNGSTAGQANSGKRLESVKMTLGNNGISGNVQYAVHLQTKGWTSYVNGGSLAGSVNSNKRIEGIRVRLTGTIAQQYDVYYRVYVQNIGWLDWACNGKDAGTSGGSFRVEAIQVKLYIKGDKPSSTANPCYNFKSNGGYLVAYNSRGQAITDTQKLFGVNTRKQLYVNLTNKIVNVVIPDGVGNYKITLKRYTVTVGKPSTPTVRGDFYIYQHRAYFDSGSARCFYFSPFKGGYGFHSVLYYQDPTPKRIKDGRLGMALSHGCVRMNVNDAKWIYDHCPIGTKVIIR